MAFPPSPAQPAFQQYDPERAARQHRLKVLALSLVALAAFLAFQAVLLARWTAVDTRPPAWDQAIHMETAWDDKAGLAQGSLSPVLHPVPKPGMPPFPPLYHLALQSALKAAHPETAALWVNYGYFVVLTLCVFGLVFYYRPDWAAAAGAVSFVCAPGVQDLLYTQLVDLPVLACSAAAYLAFLYSDEFAFWPGSLAFGVLFALGMLHKWSFFAYMIPAYVVTLKVLLARNMRKGPALAAWSLALALSVPWYFMNWPLILPRLFQASADFAIPVWQGGAFFTYFWQSLSALGPALFFLGWVGLIVPKYRRNDENGWLVPLWILSAYVFWAIVPNRQMRFLLPGLPGLAVLATGSWPAPLILATTVFQLGLAVNWARGWVGPIQVPTPFGGVTLLPANPPAREDWHVDDVLQAAEKRSDPSEPVADLVLVANDTRFNGPTFNWRLKALGLKQVKVRGVNKRLCEFARFVVVKTGSLGPGSVIGGLEEARKAMLEPGAWFARGYEKVQSWPLPDGSQADLYERRKPSAPPFSARGPVTLQYYTKGDFTGEDINIDLGRFDAAAGDYPRASVRARELSLRGMSVQRAAVEFDDLLAVPVALREEGDEWDDVRFLKLKTLRVRSLDVTAESLAQFLTNRVKGLKLDSLTLDGTLKASGTLRNFPIALELAPELQASPRALKLRLVSLKLGPNPLPVGAINRIKELTLSLEPNPEMPFAIDLPGITLRGGHLTVP